MLADTANIEVPQRYRTPVAVMTVFRPLKEVRDICGVKTRGCTVRIEDGPPVIVLPNPCDIRYDNYARDVCHEVGHVNGWGKGHGK